jgi:hypothetical protein
MASNEFRACKKAIKKAKTKSDVSAAVDVLDDAWIAANRSEKIMKETDWVQLVHLISKATDRLS